MLGAPGDAAADGWHMIEVARRLGLGALFPWQQATHVDAAWHELTRFHDDAQRRPAASAELRAQPGVQWPVVDGRATRWRYNVAHDPAADGAYGGYDFYGHADHRAWIWLRPHEPAAERPDAEYPFRLATGRVLEHTGTGTLTRRIPTLHRALPRAYAELNAADARALGIRNGDPVRLVTRRGAIVLDARVDYRAQPQPGQVFVPYFDESAPVNLLTLDVTCPLSGQPGPGMCAVRVERVAHAAATAVR
jgi:nitrate reductase (cytochrome)